MTTATTTKEAGCTSSKPSELLFWLHGLDSTVLIGEQRDRTQVATRAGADVVQRVVQRVAQRKRPRGFLDSEVGAGRPGRVRSGNWW